MSRQKLQLTLLLFFYVNLLSAQNKADLNNDGVPDLLAFADDPFPCDYDYRVTFTDGKTGKTSGVPREEYCRCHIRTLLPVPAPLWLPENAAVLDTIRARLLPAERPIADASLAWILRGAANRRPLKTNPYFDLVIDPGADLRRGEAALPETYSVRVNGKTLHNLGRTTDETEPYTEGGFLIYYGHNHYQRRDPRRNTDSVTLVTTTGGRSIYRTSHGLFVQSPTHHRWLFVTDHGLTGAPDKLRWALIGEVAVWEGRLLVLQHRRPVSGGTAVFLIDLASGRTARLRSDLVGEADDRITFALVGDSLELTAAAPGEAQDGGTELTISLKTLFKVLDRR